MIRIETILDILNKNKIGYTYCQNARIFEYEKFASIKNIIKNGIYYYEGLNSFEKLEIQESLIISKKELDKKNNYLIIDSPQYVHYFLSNILFKNKKMGISNTAIINNNAKIGKDVYIGEYSIINNCIIGDNVEIGHHVVIEDNVIIGNNTIIDSNTVIGASGLAWVWDNNGSRIMQPQLGGVIIEENCIICTDITIVRGSLTENTIIKKGTVIAHGTKIGHGSFVGENVHMANNVSLAGNSNIGNSSFLGSACVISSNVKIGKHTIVGAGAVVNKSYTDEFITLAGVPAKIINQNNLNNKSNGVPLIKNSPKN